MSELPIPTPASESPGPQPPKFEIERPQTHRRTGLLSTLQSLACTVVIAVFVITFLVQAFQIPSESMENTLLIGDYLLVDKVHFARGGIWGEILPYEKIQRGDIVVFRYPVNPTQHFVKRVVGLPGDHIHLVDKHVLVNGRPIDESHAIFRNNHDRYRDEFPVADLAVTSVDAKWWLQMRRMVHDGELVVPADQYFVLGDNRDDSLDSRYWGFVPRENIIGRPLLIYWSLEDSGPPDPVTQSAIGRVSHAAYVFLHLVQETRWDRTLRLVR